MTRLGIGIVGLRFGASIVQDLRSGPGGRDFDVVALCDRDPERAAAAVGTLGAPCYPTLDAMLADPTVDVVGVFTPPVGRAEVIEQVVRSGRDVMTTKPFERDPEKALAVLELAARLGRVVHLNSPAPVVPPDLRQIERWREEHDLGRPIGARAETWASYREVADGSWYDSDELCPVAPVFRLGIYVINDLVHLLGDAAEVRVIESRVRTGRPTADNGLLTIRFANNALATVFASFCIDDGQQYKDSLVVSYERGSIYRSHAPGPTSATPELLLARPGENGPVVERATVAARSGDYDWAAFRAAIDSRTILSEVGPELIVAGLRIVDAMSRARLTGTAQVLTRNQPTSSHMEVHR